MEIAEKFGGEDGARSMPCSRLQTLLYADRTCLPGMDRIRMARNRQPTARSGRPTPSRTTAQQLGSLIKSARDIMRKDKGLSGDLDRLPMLTWIMFLKFLDDMEQIEESRAKLGRKKYRPAIEPPYRWRDWAANEQGITGPELLAFINQEEATRPDGTKGPGLFAYLRSLRAAQTAAATGGRSSPPCFRASSTA